MAHCQHGSFDAENDINLEKEQELSNQFGVRSIPALFYMEDGEIIDKASGSKTIEELKQLTKTN